MSSTWAPGDQNTYLEEKKSTIRIKEGGPARVFNIRNNETESVRLHEGCVDQLGSSRCVVGGSGNRFDRRMKAKPPGA